MHSLSVGVHRRCTLRIYRDEAVDNHMVATVEIVSARREARECREVPDLLGL
jgi:hypothetical protein